MILVKLGGSVITNKKKPLSPRRAAIGRMAGCMAEIEEPVVMVHGGGSFGHYWSVRYDMHTAPDRYDHTGVATVKNSMVGLNRIILDAMLKAGASPYVVPPAGFISRGRAVRSRVQEMADIAESGMIPVTYGDALWHGRGDTYILSGDRIMRHLARMLTPRLCIFALDEDGLYTDMESKELIKEITPWTPRIEDDEADVTGGMARKVDEARTISSYGMDVLLVNGNRPDRMVKAVKNGEFEGTLFRGV